MLHSGLVSLWSGQISCSKATNPLASLKGEMMQPYDNGKGPENFMEDGKEKTKPYNGEEFEGIKRGWPSSESRYSEGCRLIKMVESLKEEIAEEREVKLDHAIARNQYFMDRQRFKEENAKLKEELAQKYSDGYSKGYTKGKINGKMNSLNKGKLRRR